MGNQKKRSTNRRELGKARRQTGGSTGRRKLAGPGSAKQPGPLGRQARPPARLRRLLQKLGKRIESLRKQKGLSTVQFANDCGLSTVEVERIEGGQVDVSLAVILRLANRLGLSVADFLKGI